MKTENARPSVATLLSCLLLLLAGFLAYRPVWNATFLWDDEFLVLRNPLIRSPVLALEIFRHFLFTDARGEFYRPMQNLSYLIDYYRAGFDASAYHCTNLLIHAANGCLVYLLTRRLIRQVGNVSTPIANRIGLAIAFFWLLHPVHSAIAAYVAGRADSLALLGLLTAWLFWENTIEAQSKSVRGILFFHAGLLALAGCCAKEISMAGLGLFLGYLWILRRDLANSFKWKTSAGVLFVFLVYLGLRQLPDPNIAPSTTEILSWTQKLELFFRALGDYARLVVYPGKLFMERQVSTHTGLFTDPIKNDPLFPILGWVGGFMLVALLGAVFWCGRGQKLRILGALWFIAMILPVSNLFTLNASVAEHWLYIPLIGLLLWLSGCWLDCQPNVRRIGVALLPVLLLLLAARTYQRAGDWHDPLTFYKATIRDGGDSIRVRLNLAAEYQKLGRLTEGEKIYRSILSVVPDLSLAKVSLVRNLQLQKRTAEAEALLAQDTHSNQRGLGERTAVLDLLTQSKQFDAATQMAREAYEANPNSWPMAQALANIYIAQEKPRVAIEVVKGFVARNWWHAESHIFLAELSVSQGEMAPATKLYLAAARLDVRDGESLSQAAILLAQSGKFMEAETIQQKAIERNPSTRQNEIMQAIRTLRVPGKVQ